MITVPVAVVPRPYDVLIGPGVRAELASLISSVAPSARRAGIVTQQHVIDAGWLDAIDPGIAFCVVTIGESEDDKSLGTVEAICRTFVQEGLSRHDVVVALGGGLVSDVAGLAASVYHRGVAYVTVATTLLAQVDAAVGGKTGVNLPEGKNLVGTFWQPAGVLADMDTLATLPPGEWACGRGEMAKYAFLGPGEPSAEILSQDLSEQVARCVAIKAQIVADDEREAGRRMVLNYGHTLAHALEAVGLERRASGRLGRVSELRHGEAVAIGLIFAAQLAERLGRIDAARVDLHRRVVTGFDLETDLPEDLDATQLIDAMARDKKAHHDLTFILDGANGPEPVSGVEPSVVLATLRDMGAA